MARPLSPVVNLNSKNHFQLFRPSEYWMGLSLPAGPSLKDLHPTFLLNDVELSVSWVAFHRFTNCLSLLDSSHLSLIPLWESQSSRHRSGTASAFRSKRQAELIVILRKRLFLLELKELKIWQPDLQRQILIRSYTRIYLACVSMSCLSKQRGHRFYLFSDKSSWNLKYTSTYHAARASKFTWNSLQWMRRLHLVVVSTSASVIVWRLSRQHGLATVDLSKC